MQTLAQIRAALELRGLAPRHALGQNFLIDHNLLRKLVTAAGVAPGDTVLEVGPGTGALTVALLEAGARVVACELDAGLAALLRETLGTEHGPDRFVLIEGDALEHGRRLSRAAIEALGEGPFALVSNLPYAAATPLIMALLIDHACCATLAVTIQREVADRLAARPDSKAYGTLGIVAQAMAEVLPMATLPPECFWPRPKVTSAMVVLRRRAVPLADRPADLTRFCQRLFSARRKQIGSILGRDCPYPVGVDPRQRPENLSVEQIIALMALHHRADDPTDPPAGPMF